MASQPILVPYVDQPAEQPPMLIRQPGDRGGPDYIKLVRLREVGENSISLEGVTTEQHLLALTLQFITPGILHIYLSDPTVPDGQRTTFARHDAQQPVTASFTHTDQSLTWDTSDLHIELVFDPFDLAIFGPQGQILLRQAHEVLDPTGRLRVLPLGKTAFAGRHIAFHETFMAAPDEHFYGFGEKFTNFDKRGQELVMWNTDAAGTFSERSYKNVPFFISSRGYGIFVDSVMPTHFDMAASNESVFSIAVPDTALDYYIIAGPAPKTIISRYADLVGHPTLPPKWAFGLWMSSGFEADSAAKTLERAQQLRAHQIPCDVIHMDCFWQRFGQWSNFQWDAAAFPDPPSLVAQLKALHFQVCLWINSYISVESDLFRFASEQGYLLKTPTGDPYTIDAWFGFHPPVGIIDLTHPEAVTWFTEMLRSLLRMGVAVFKTDFGEGVPADAVAFNGMSGVQLHNLYPLLYNDIVSNVTFEETGSRLVWGRSTFAGGQRHAAQWGGDTSCTDQGLASTLRGGLSIGVCGHAFWSHDIGGFNRQPTPDLFVRWSQFGMLSPLARAHGMSSRLPWDYGEAAEAYFRASVQLRYQLLPYIYSYAHEAVKTGLPLLRAMVVEYPDDPVAATLDLQYCFGADLLVALPFDDSASRWVYFPEGKWIDYWTNDIIPGPQMRQVATTKEHLPLYVRANAIIPMIASQEWIDVGPFQHVQFTCYVIDAGQVVMHDDDGDTTLAVTRQEDQLWLQVATPKPAITLRLVALSGMLPMNAVWLHDVQIPFIAADAADHATGAWWVRQEDGSVNITVTQG